MDNEFVKKLTSKNQTDFEFAASHIINNCDLEAFSALVEKSGFLFDFIKENVKKRLANVINQNNFKNLIGFLKIYSSDYEEWIVSSLVKYANEDLTDEMLELLEDGTNQEKAYAAKYFSRINDPLCIEPLKKFCFSEFEPLSYNCAEALGAMKEETVLNSALEKLKSEDDFEKIEAIKFLIAYKAQGTLELAFDTMKKSSMSENIAAEIPYIESLLNLLDTKHKDNALLAINYILNGFGEIISLSQVFDFEFYDIFEKIAQDNSSKAALTILNAKLKFEQLTENDEYIFDEDKSVKQEVQEITNLLNSYPESFWIEKTKLIQYELKSESNFVYFALQIVQDMALIESFSQLQELLDSKNQTIILKSIEVIKSLNKLEEINAEKILNTISDENIKKIIQALF